MDTHLTECIIGLPVQISKQHVGLNPTNTLSRMHSSTSVTDGQQADHTMMKFVAICRITCAMIPPETKQTETQAS